MNVFITGASSGIGEALARYYATRSATVGLFARREVELARIAADMSAVRTITYAGDVRDSTALAQAGSDFIERCGTPDIVIANAGVSHGTLTEHPEDQRVFDTILATNVSATVATFAPFIATMKTQASARRLVGIGSVAGIRGLPGAGAYSASKAAVLCYCESLRIELRASGIEVVTIAPGYIATPMTEQNAYPMPFLMPVERFASAAVRAIARGDSYRVIPWQMGVVAKLLRLLPNWLYDLALSRAPHKARKEAL